MDPATIGAAIKGGMTIASSAKSLFGSGGGDGIDVSENNRLMGKQYLWNRAWARDEYGRTMASMRKAGLNPILAYGRQPSSGAGISSGVAPNYSAKVEKMRQSYDLKRQLAEIDVLNSQKDLNSAKKEKALAETVSEGLRPDQIKAETQRLKSQYDLNVKDTERLEKVIDHLQEDIYLKRAMKEGVLHENTFKHFVAEMYTRYPELAYLKEAGLPAGKIVELVINKMGIKLPKTKRK